MGKKYGSRPVAAHERIFFSEVGVVARHPGCLGCFTDASFSGKAIHAASAGAQVAGLQQEAGLFDPSVQIAFLTGLNIRWFDHCSGLRVSIPWVPVR